MSDYDALIIGGGPAGSTLAALLAQQNRRVVVIERDRFPRFQVGESLLPQSVEVFAKLGLNGQFDGRFIRKYGAIFDCADSGRQCQYEFEDAISPQYPYAYQVQRAEFDSLLLDRARELGAEVMQPCKVSDVLFENERAVGVRCQTNKTTGATTAVELRAPVVVDSTGRSSLLATRHGAKKRIADLSTGAMFAHYDGVPRLDGRSEGHIRIVVFEHGWIWFIPFLGGSTSVGAVVTSAWMRKRARASISDFFARTLARAEPARALIENATRTTDVQSVADFSYEVEPFVGDGWLCVGDACGFIDPLFSTGAHLAIKGADLAADAIDAALSAGDTSATAFAHYDQTIRYARELFLGVVQAFYRGEFRELLFWEDKRPTLHRIITSLLSGDVIFSDKPPTWARWAKQAYPVQVS